VSAYDHSAWALAARRGRRRHDFRATVGSLVCVLIGVIYVVPLLWVLSASLQSSRDAFQSPLVPHSFRMRNYADAWTQFGLGLLFRNSVLITAAAVVGGVALSFSAAYGFSRFRSRTLEAVFLLLLLGLMVPPAAIITPFFVGVRELGLYNTLTAVVLGEIAFFLPFGVLVFRGYMERIPEELLDAARVDGAPERVILLRIVLPQLRAAIATVGIFFALASWNDFLLPLILIRDSSASTVTVGMSRFGGEFGTFQWELVAAGSVIAIVPMLVLFTWARRFYLAGITAGALKQ
jgi:ABC-type glycerol-3-phosphate transport system permease component